MLVTSSGKLEIYKTHRKKEGVDAGLLFFPYLCILLSFTHIFLFLLTFLTCLWIFFGLIK